VRRWWSDLIDGEHGWGSFDVRLGRSGFRRYRLTVLPPGITVKDRRLLRLWRSWPIGGVLLWLIVAMCLNVSSPATTLAALVGMYLGTGAALFALTAGTRPRVRSMSLTLVKGYGWPIDPSGEAARKAWEKLTGVMLAAEDMLQRGTLSPVEYEAVWWEIYDRIEAVAEIR
jgi:hypothetical protein